MSSPSASRARATADRLGLIDAANERMRQAKFSALATYEKVHPAGHARCGEACRMAHRDLLVAMSDANSDYQSAIDERRR